MKKTIFLLAATLILSFGSSCSLINIRSGVDVNMLEVERSEPGEPVVDDGPIDNPVALKMHIPDTQSASSDLDIADPDFDFSNRTGFYIGLSLSDVGITEKLTLQPELNYIGVKDFNQLQVPALLNYHITDRFNAQVGPSLSLLLNAPANVKTTNLSVDFGVSYNISERFSLEARYDLGVTNLLENATSGDRLKMSNLQMGVSYKLGTSN